MLEMMQMERGFPKLICNDFSGNHRYYIMERLKSTLHDLMDNGVTTNSKELAKLAIGMLHRIKAVHAKKHIIYDLSDTNFMVDHHHRVYAIDLAMAYPYETAGRFLPKYAKNTPFAAKCDDEMTPCTRRDEMQRFLFVLVYLRFRKLPWGFAGKDMTRMRGAMKPSEICKGGAEWLIPLFDHVGSLGPLTEPDYNLFERVFMEKANR
jgi:hypothetical protein